MALRCGPPFDFDLNAPPPEDDVASPAREPEPVREPSPRDLLPPSPQDTLPSPQHDSLPLQAPAPVPETSPCDPLPAPVPPESSDLDPRPSPSHREPSPRDPLHLPSPVLDLEAPLSSLDDDYDEEYYDEAELPPPPPLPPSGMVPIASAALAPSSSSVNTAGALPSRPDRHGEIRTASQEPFVGDAAARRSSPEDSAPRGPSISGTASSHRSRRRPLHSSYDPRDDDAISKQRRVGSYDDDDAGSSRSGSRRSELASPPPHYEQGGGGGRNAPLAHGEPGGPPRNRRRRPRRVQGPPQQHGGYEYTGSIPKQQQGRGWEQPQGLRGGGQERPQAHHSHGPHGLDPTRTKVGFSSSYYPLTTGSYEDGRRPVQEPINGNGGYHHHQRREAPPPPSSRPRGREDPYYGQRSQAPKAGGYQHREGAEDLGRSKASAHGWDNGGRPRPAQQPVNGGGAYHQQRKAAPRGSERFPDRAYHPYARDGGGAFDRSNGGGFDRQANGGNQGRREPRPPPNYDHRRRDNNNKQQRTAGGPARARQYYGD